MTVSKPLVITESPVKIDVSEMLSLRLLRERS